MVSELYRLHFICKHWKISASVSWNHEVRGGTHQLILHTSTAVDKTHGSSIIDTTVR